MHIVVEPSDYVLKNAGDMAMQEVAVTRLAARWPQATILVLTDTPDDLPRYAGNVRPLDSRGRRRWLARTRMAAAQGRLARLRAALRAPWRRSEPASSDPEREFVQTISSASLVLVSGMGGITDVFADYATGLLQTLALAMRSGVPTAMMGQGMGPLGGGSLRHLAASILPHVDLIALREARAGLPLLTDLGVAPDRIVTTGDDAIEIAFDCASADVGPALGVNLRRASYAEVDAGLVELVRSALAACARRHAAPLVPVPISRVGGEEDAVTIAALLGEPAEHADLAPLSLPALLERIRGCRVVVTGSYHAGVFALASGVPVVALAHSPYYLDKFHGLAEQFGTGCAVVHLGEPEAAARIESAVAGAWEASRQARLRVELLQAAARQIALGHAAYQRVHDLVERRAAVSR